MMPMTGAWLMEPIRLAGLCRRVHSSPLSALKTAVHAPARPILSRRGSLAVVRIEGVLVRSMPAIFSWLEVTATETPAIEHALSAALDDDQVQTIVLHVDSPGGESAGIADLADLVFEARSKKRVVSVVESLCASGAYWLASQADELVAAKDALVGSIGAFDVWEDSSAAAEREGYRVHVVRSGEHKGMGVPGAPITDAQLAATQELVDGVAAIFVSAVARGRGIAKSEVRDAATGQLWLAGSARARGLIDRIEPPARAFERLEAERSSPSKRSATRASASPENPFLTLVREYAGRGASPKAMKSAKRVCRKLEPKLWNGYVREKKARAAIASPPATSPTPVPAATSAPAPEETTMQNKDAFVEEAKAYAAAHGCKLHEAMSAIATKKAAEPSRTRTTGELRRAMRAGRPS